MRILIVGGGKVGRHAAEILLREQHQITVIEKNQERAEFLANSLDVLVINSDGTNMEALRDGGIEKSDMVLALTSSDKGNLMVCEIAKSLEVPRIIARVNEPENEEVFVKLGITGTVPITQMATNTIENLLAGGRYKKVAEVCGGSFEVIEVTVSRKSQLVGRKGMTVGRGVISAIYRNGTGIIPKEDTKIEAGDVLVVTTPPEGVEEIIELAGESRDE